MPATVFADSVSLGKRIYNICHLQVTDASQLIIKWTLFDYVSTLKFATFGCIIINLWPSMLVGTPGCGCICLFISLENKQRNESFASMKVD